MKNFIKEDKRMKNFIKTYRENTIEHYCGKVIHKYKKFEKRGKYLARLVKTEKYNKVWMILND